jgi:hypothetical protein
MGRSRNGLCKAKILLFAIADSDFVIAIHVLSHIFAVTLPLSKALQSEGTDMVQAISGSHKVNFKMNTGDSTCNIFAVLASITQEKSNQKCFSTSQILNEFFNTCKVKVILVNFTTPQIDSRYCRG